MMKYRFFCRMRMVLLPFFFLCSQSLTQLAAQNAESEELQYPGKSLRDGILQLASLHESAVRNDPTSVAAHVGMSEAYTMYWCFGFAPRDEVLPKLKSAARKAVELDDQHAGARTSLGIAKLSEWDWLGAEKDLAAAVRLDPDRAQSHHWYALYLAARGRHHEAIKASERAVALDSSPGMQTGLGSILYFGRDWKRLIGQMNATIEKHPEFAPAYDWLGMAYVQEHRFDESIATYERSVELSEGLAEILAGLGHAYGLAGKEEQARRVIRRRHLIRHRVEQGGREFKGW